MTAAKHAESRLFVAESGSGDRALVFIHGFACDVRDWQPQQVALSPGYHCIAIDLPGHGASPPPRNATIEALAEAANRELAARSIESAILIGHSMGCRVISAMYARAPERVRGLIYIDGSLLGEGDPETAASRMEAAFEAHGTSSLLDRLFIDFFVPTTPASVKTLVDGRRPAVKGDFARALTLSLARWDSKRAHEVLRTLHVPVCAIQSTKMGMDLRRVSLGQGESTPWMQAIEQAQPAAAMHVVEGVGHFTMLEAPAETARIVAGFAASVFQ